MTADRKSPKMDALRAMREANWAEAMADVPKPLRRAAKPDELRALAKAAAERASKDKPIKAPLSEPKRSPAQTALAERKRQKSRGRIAKMLAKKSGATAAMPLSGKAALAKIAEPETMETTMSKKTTKKTKAKTKPRTKRSAKPAKAVAGDKTIRPGSKLEIVAGLLTRKEGCTLADVLRETGWPSCSMPQMANSAGLALRRDKAKGEPTRYFGSSAAAKAA